MCVCCVDCTRRDKWDSEQDWRSPISSTVLAVVDMSFHTAIVPARCKAAAVSDGVDDDAARTLRRHVTELTLFHRQPRTLWARRRSTPEPKRKDDKTLNGVEKTPLSSEPQRPSTRKEAVVAPPPIVKKPAARPVASSPEKAPQLVRRSSRRAHGQKSVVVRVGPSAGK